jgi:hypothetical protein
MQFAPLLKSLFRELNPTTSRVKPTFEENFLFDS